MSKPNWIPVEIRLGEIIPWTHNPRMSNKAQAQRLIDSEKKWGQPLPFSVSPCVDGKYQLYDGHQRYSAFLTVYGENHKVAASMCDRELTDAERAELVFTLHAGATGSWDWDKVASFPEATQWGFDLDKLKETNFDALNLREMLNGDGEQIDPMEEWEGMPEFHQEDKTAMKSIIVHFDSQEAIDNFAELVKQTITPKTRSIWYPKAKIDKYMDKGFVDAS